MILLPCDKAQGVFHFILMFPYSTSILECTVQQYLIIITTMELSLKNNVLLLLFIFLVTLCMRNAFPVILVIITIIT